MTLYEFVNENAGMMRELILSKIIRSNFEEEIAVYHFFHCQLKETGSRMQAATNCGDAFRISERKVFRIVKRYGQPFDTKLTNGQK